MVKKRFFFGHEREYILHKSFFGKRKIREIEFYEDMLRLNPQKFYKNRIKRRDISRISRLKWNLIGVFIIVAWIAFFVWIFKNNPGVPTQTYYPIAAFFLLGPVASCVFYLKGRPIETYPPVAEATSIPLSEVPSNEAIECPNCAGRGDYLRHIPGYTKTVTAKVAEGNPQVYYEDIPARTVIEKCGTCHGKGYFDSKKFRSLFLGLNDYLAGYNSRINKINEKVFVINAFLEKKNTQIEKWNKWWNSGHTKRNLPKSTNSDVGGGKASDLPVYSGSRKWEVPNDILTDAGHPLWHSCQYKDSAIRVYGCTVSRVSVDEVLEWYLSQMTSWDFEYFRDTRSWALGPYATGYALIFTHRRDELAATVCALKTPLSDTIYVILQIGPKPITYNFSEPWKESKYLLPYSRYHSQALLERLNSRVKNSTNVARKNP